MIRRSLFRFVLALIATIEVTSTPIRDFESGRKAVWQNIGVRSFYGPWDISIKRNGDYVDYNDYDVRVEQFRPNSMSYDDVSISNGYIDALPSVYDSGPSKFNTLFGSVGLADFRNGVRTGDWIDRNTDSLKERYSEDIASKKIDQDAGESDGSVILKL